MTDVVFAFGPDGYFFESQTQWRMKDLPQRLAARFSSGASDIAHVYSLVLGAGESWFMSYRTKIGGASFAHDGLPDKLAAWLRVKDANGFSVRDIRRLRVSLGPSNASFWADDGRDYFWDNLPSPLQLALEKLKSPQGGWARAPTIVVLGLYQSYVMLSEGGGGSYALSDYYPWLEKELVALIRSGKPGALKAVHHISIDQHDGQNFVMTLVDGKVMYYVPDQLNADMVAIRATIPLGTTIGTPGGREAETGTNPMPIPHTVSIPATGPDPYRSPEEMHGQNPLSGSNMNVVSNVVHAPPTPVGQPAPPYTTSPFSSETRVATPHASQVHSGQTPGPSMISQLDRVGSPQSVYQHPRVAALENAAATTRIVSPAPTMSTAQYSYEAAQANLNGATQRIMSAAPAAGSQSAVSANTMTASQVPSGQLPASHGPGSPSPVSLNTGTPLQSSQVQQVAPVRTYSNPTGSPVAQQVAHPSSQGITPTGTPQNTASTPTVQLQVQATSQPIPQTAQDTASQVQSSASPPPVPNPTPVPYTVQFAGSAPSSLASSQISQASVHAPVPVIRTPGSYPAHVDTIPIPAFSTPAPLPTGPQPPKQLVSIPLRPIMNSQPSGQASSPTQSYTLRPVGVAEVSASPPPHRQSIASSTQMLPPASPARDEITNLPGTIPFMPPTVASPVSHNQSPSHSPMHMSGPTSSGLPPSISPQPQYKTVSVPNANQPRPQLVSVASAPTQQALPTTGNIQQGQPELVRIVSAPGPVQIDNASVGAQPQVVQAIQQQRHSISSPVQGQQIQYIQQPHGQQPQIQYVQVMHGTQQVLTSPATSPPPAAMATAAVSVPAGPSTAAATEEVSAAAPPKTEAQLKKEKQQAAKNKKLAIGIGLGLAKVAIKAAIN